MHIEKPEIREASRISKKTWWTWKQNGAPVNADHPLQVAMKQAKCLLRQAQRRANAERRQDDLNEIMDAKDTNVVFHRLIRNQRSTETSSTNCIIVKDKTLSTTDEITHGWADHFKSLATPNLDSKYDDSFLQQAQQELSSIEEIIQQGVEVVKPVDVVEVNQAISNLNTNKAPDHFGLMAEHFRYGGEALHVLLAIIINSIFSERKCPTSLKTGIVTPVFKKGDPKYPDNYRGITITPILLKIIEHVLCSRQKITLLPSQSPLQSGFTKGTSSARSALLVTECQLEAKSMKKKLTLITLDTKKAFDVVNHDILLRNLYFDGICPAEWQLLKDLYCGMNSCVKWQGQISSPFDVRQGVRQGGVLSTEHYKRYNNPLLLNIEDNFQGARIGGIRIPHTTCADDIALMSHSDWEVKLMLKVVEDFSKCHRYEIHPKKSACIVQNSKHMPNQNGLTLGGECIPITTSTKHLGVHRDIPMKVNTEEKINIGRRTAYSLLGEGFHGRSGLSQDVKAHIWSTYVIPRMLYGIEVLPYKQSYLNKLDSFQIKTLKQIQHLPDRAANAAATALLGILPASAQVHKNTLNLYYSIARCPGTVEHDVAMRQLAVKSPQDPSFFSRVRQLLALYDLPSAFSLITNPPPKETWKSLLKDAVNQYTENSWRTEIAAKSSLKYVNPEAIQAGQPHHIYRCIRPNHQDVRRAELKARLLTGTYTLQANRAVFNQYTVDPTCKLCNVEPETRCHLISVCTRTLEIREKYRRKILSVIENHTEYNAQEVLDHTENFTHLVLDCTHPQICRSVKPTDCPIDTLELLTREYLAKLHHFRCRELAKLNP